jgi:hypothetical protein
MAYDTTYSLEVVIRESGEEIDRFSVEAGGVVTWTEKTHQRLSVPTATTDLAIQFGGCSAGNLVFVSTDKTISIKISGGTQAITINSFAVLSGDISAMTLTNASGSTAVVDILILD